MHELAKIHSALLTWMTQNAISDRDRVQLPEYQEVSVDPETAVIGFLQEYVQLQAQTLGAGARCITALLTKQQEMQVQEAARPENRKPNRAYPD